MVNSFKSWDSLNEGFGTKRKSRQVYKAPNGKKYKVIVKVQNDKQFMVRTINEIDLVDQKGNMIPVGAAHLVAYLNNQQALVNTFGKIDATFFATKVLIYKVIKDTDRIEKIQYTVTPRTEVPGLDAKIEFVSIDALEAMQNKSEILGGLIGSTVDLANQDTTEEEPAEIIPQKVSDATGNENSKRAAGTKFRYQMRANNKLYLCEFMVDGGIEATVISGDRKPNGAVSWDEATQLSMWMTDADNIAEVSNEVLFMDMEIVDPTDKKFFYRIFNDGDYLDEIVKAYEDEFGDSELSAENLKGMLYYSDGVTKIFTAAAADASGVAGETGAVNTSGLVGRLGKEEKHEIAGSFTKK